MEIIDLIRLVRKHLVLLLLIPIALASLVTYFTRIPTYSYSSETTLYTGIASGSSVELDKTFSYFANTTAFDNLINIIKSRETQQEVSIRLLAQHLMFSKPDPRYISKKSYDDLRKITPDYIYSLVMNSPEQTVGSEQKQSNNGRDTTQINIKQNIEFQQHTVKEKETLFSISRQYGISVDKIKELNNLQSNSISKGQTLRISKQVLTKLAKETTSATTNENDSTTFSFAKLDNSPKNYLALPTSINPEAYEQTVKNLETYMASSDTNFIYKLLNFAHPHYSIKAISAITVLRIGSSDLVRLKYDSNEPGICRQTLALVTEVCIKNYKLIKENRSDAIVKYFEYQLRQASARLKVGEDKLLRFNEENNIINYYEQSKAVAIVKEDLDVEYNAKRIKLASIKAALNRIEEKLGGQRQIQLKSVGIIEKRNQLSEINTKIATYEMIGFGKTPNDEQLIKLKMSSDKLKDEIRSSINDLYSYGNSTEGLPVSILLNDWIANVIEYESIKAGLDVLAERIKEFQKQYSIYAPAGANIKRIEREISVSEQEFLEILHGLNQAKLKMQDAELSSTIKAVDPPFYPLSPNPTKRSMLIIAAAFVGFILVLTTILATEYFDDTLKNSERASKNVNLKTIGIFPKIFLKTGTLNFLFVANRLLEIIIQQIDLLTSSKADLNEPRIILFLSSLNTEGKSVIAGNIARKLKKQGKKVVFLNFSRESLRQTEANQIGYKPKPPKAPSSGFSLIHKRILFISWMLGYGDNRIDTSSQFLKKQDEYLDNSEYALYQFDDSYFSASNYKNLIEENYLLSREKPNYVLIELPSILYYSFPTQLIASADLAILVCRANRIWSNADKGALDIVKKKTSQEPVIILNGVELQAIESVLGDLPKKRIWLRRIAKKIIRLQFYSRYET